MKIPFDLRFGRPLLLSAAVTLLFCNIAKGEPSAIVEEFSSGVKGVQFLSYLQNGDHVNLGAEGRLVLGYLKSCIVEKIVGGTVQVGSRQSVVSNGAVKRERVVCDGGESLSIAIDSKGGGLIFRDSERQTLFKGDRKGTKVFSLFPFFQIPESADRIHLQRLDGFDAPIVVKLDSRFLDLKNRKPLTPGALYLVEAGPYAEIFRVDKAATSDTKSILGRLIRLSKTRNQK